LSVSIAKDVLMFVFPDSEMFVAEHLTESKGLLKFTHLQTFVFSQTYEARAYPHKEHGLQVCKLLPFLSASGQSLRTISLRLTYHFNERMGDSSVRNLLQDSRWKTVDEALSNTEVFSVFEKLAIFLDFRTEVDLGLEEKVKACLPRMRESGRVTVIGLEYASYIYITYNRCCVEMDTNYGFLCRAPVDTRAVEYEPYFISKAFHEELGLQLY
jgi:hypothetical protein